MPSDQHLYFRELELNGSSTLAECDIPPGATLFLKVRVLSTAFCFFLSLLLFVFLYGTTSSRSLFVQTDDPIPEEGCCSFAEPLGTR